MTVAVQINEVQAPVLQALEHESCARLLEETYGALQGWEPGVENQRFQDVCLGMAKKLQLGAMNQTCMSFATAAVQARRQGLPPLPQLEELWCMPAKPTTKHPSVFARLQNVTMTASQRLSSWWSGRSHHGTTALIQVVPGSQMVMAADFAKRRKQQLIDAAKRTLDFFCDDACGLAAPPKLRIV